MAPVRERANLATSCLSGIAGQWYNQRTLGMGRIAIPPNLSRVGVPSAMPTPRRAEIRQQKTLVEEGAFKVNEIVAAYSGRDGTMHEQKRLVFERGASAAVLLLNIDTDCVILVDQFRLPTLIARRHENPATANGWLTEAVAGMIDAEETPEQTVIRETKEETGYRLRDPKLICSFFASPGGTSERIFLYFAQVTNADKIDNGGGVGDEEITIIEQPISQLFERLTKGQIEDPKLVIAAYWLQDRVKEPLGPSTMKFQITKKPGLIVGYKTGAIDNVTGVDVWVNSENTDMTMDRFIGRSVSARIRFLGANKNDRTIVRDTIQEALHQKTGGSYVRIGTVLMTDLGMLSGSNDVERIFHVATVEGRPGSGIAGKREDLPLCVTEVLKKVDEENTKFSLLRRTKFDFDPVPDARRRRRRLANHRSGRTDHPRGHQVSAEHSRPDNPGNLFPGLQAAGQMCMRATVQTVLRRRNARPAGA